MSHIHTYKAKIASAARFMSACQELGATEIELSNHTIQQFGSNQVECVASCLLPGWKYKIAVTAKGEIKYDHWGSESNTMEVLGKVVQQYWRTIVHDSIDWSEVESLEEKTLENGDLQLIMEF